MIYNSNESDLLTDNIPVLITADIYISDICDSFLTYSSLAFKVASSIW